MTITQLTRTYYYDGELLAKNDFIRDQQYVRDIVAVQNQNLYTPGVVSGLTVSHQGSSLTLQTGLAFNVSGTPVVVLTPITRNLANDGLNAGTYLMAVDYGDNSKNNPNIQNLQSTHTIIEQPLLLKPALQANATTTGVILGTVTVDSSGTITATDNTGRQTAQINLGQTTPAAPAPAPGGGAGTTQLMAVNPAGAPVAGGQQAATLSVGQALAGTGSPGKAPLTVGLDYAAGTGSQAVASFGFENGAGQTGVVALGVAGAAGVYDLISLTYNGKPVWHVDQTGSPYSASDAALKTDISPVRDALNIIGRLNGVAYSHEGVSARRVGLLAQDVAAALPEAVHTSADGLQAVAYNAVIGVLVEAVKALTGRVEALEAAQAASAKPTKAPKAVPGRPVTG